MGKPKVAFVCVHNSCRSQMAEALGKKLACDVFESYSGGTEVKDCINPDAVRMMKQLHGIDMEETQYSKLVSQLPQPDVVIYMGCNVSCPAFTAPYTENWGLEDPTGQSDEVFEETIQTICNKILALKEKLS
ncbi:MAG TPA: arsenate reductase ArsC [Candidatus Enterenecus faecium]|uniref:Arsenate reductase ArsC n=1 Tax=Candidatus Enterenecus faecium TaxID=2840780 RepID=A0A9D1CGI3_9FIRM|nr:arsenate reductase ArsC [Candidatus Enterenecus faecium]